MHTPDTNRSAWMYYMLTDIDRVHSEEEFGTWNKGIWSINVNNLGVR